MARARKREYRASNDYALAFGNRVRELRLGNGWSQYELSERASLARTHLAGIESATRNPTLAVIARIAEALDVPIRGLFD